MEDLEDLEERARAMILDGRYVAQLKREALREQILAMKSKESGVPCLAIVIVGHNPASETYVANKIKACEQVGIEVRKIALEENVPEEEKFLTIIRENADKMKILPEFRKYFSTELQKKYADCFQ